MPSIPDEFVPLYVRYRRDRAIRRVGNDGELMYLRSLAHAKGEKTGGHIEDFDLDDIGAGIADKHDVARRLVEENLWLKVDNGWFIRSFLKWSPYEDRSADGARGNHERWHTNRGITNPDCIFCNPEPAPTQKGGESGAISGANRDTNRRARARAREELEEKETSSQLRSDVAAVLDHLEHCIRNNGAKVPNRTKANRDAARLLIDNDHRPLDEIHQVIDFATSDNFWKANIISAKKLREKYDTLRIQSQRRTAGTQRPDRTAQIAANARAMFQPHDTEPPADPADFDIIEGELA